MKTLELVLKAGTAGACLYETVAIAANFAGVPIPTISKEVGLHAWLGLPILAGLGVHLYWAQIKKVFGR